MNISHMAGGFAGFGASDEQKRASRIRVARMFYNVGSDIEPPTAEEFVRATTGHSLVIDRRLDNNQTAAQRQEEIEALVSSLSNPETSLEKLKEDLAELVEGETQQIIETIASNPQNLKRLLKDFESSIASGEEGLILEVDPYLIAEPITAD